MNFNDFTSFILRSPIHGLLSGNTMLITVTGRKTGRQISTPVNYYPDGNLLWVVSKRDRKWWRNVQGGAGVQLCLRGKEIHANAEAILEDDIVTVQLGEYVRRFPMSAKSLGIRIVDRKPEPADLAQAAHEWLIVRVKLEE